MLKKFILLLCFIAPLALVAQDKIAYVNAGEVFEKMPELKDIESKLAVKGEALQKTAEAIQTEYQTKMEAHTKKLQDFSEKGEASGITESELQDGQKQLMQLQERYETNMQSAQAEYQKYQQELLAPVHEKVRKAIKDVGDEQNYTYILDVSALLHVSPSATNATQQVKTKLGITN